MINQSGLSWLLNVSLLILALGGLVLSAGEWRAAREVNLWRAHYHLNGYTEVVGRFAVSLERACMGRMLVFIVIAVLALLTPDPMLEAVRRFELVLRLLLLAVVLLDAWAALGRARLRTQLRNMESERLGEVVTVTAGEMAARAEGLAAGHVAGVAASEAAAAVTKAAVAEALHDAAAKIEEDAQPIAVTVVPSDEPLPVTVIASADAPVPVDVVVNVKGGATIEAPGETPAEPSPASPPPPSEGGA